MGEPLNLAHLRAVAEVATQGEWCYRPDPHDDWGWVRSSDGDIIAMARAGRLMSEDELWDHRRDKTDPYGPNALHIATFDPPSVLALIARAEAAGSLAEQTRRDGMLAFWTEESVKIAEEKARTEGFRAGQEAMRKRASEAAASHGATVSNEAVGKACARNIARAIAALPVEGME